MTDDVERVLADTFAQDWGRLVATLIRLTGDIDAATAPLRLAGVEGAYNVTVHVEGGGITGQTSAIQLGIARALLKVDPELRSPMRRAGFLTRDARVKERKKPGLKRARKAPTYTKR